MPNKFTLLLILPAALAALALSSCVSETVLPPEATLTEAPAVVESAPPTFSATPEPTSTPTLALTATPTATATPMGVQPEDLAGIRLQFWHPWTGDRELAILTLVNQFNAQNDYGIVVTAFSQGGDLYQGIRAGINAGALPHIAAAYNNQVQSWDNYGNVIVDLNDYVDDPTWGMAPEEQDEFYPLFWAHDVVDGKRLGLPVYRSAMLLFYNQTWAQSLGFDAPPTTPAEFKEQACAAAAANNDGTGGWIAKADSATLMTWIMAFGGTGINAEGDGYEFNTPEIQAAFEFVKSLFKSGCAWIPEAYYPNDEFAARQGLFYTSSISGLPYQTYAMQDANSSDQWMAIAYPSPDGDPVLNMSGPTYAVFETSEEEQTASWLFVKWLTRPENQALFVEASGYFPTRQTANLALERYAVENPRWAQAQALIPYGRVEPSFGSWGLVRWAVSDAAKELVNPNFLSEDIPLLLENLDVAVAEIHLENR